MKKTDIRDYFIIHEERTSEEDAQKHFKVLSENAINVGGNKIFTLKFETVLQSAGKKNFNNRLYRTAKTIINGAMRNPVLVHYYNLGLLAGEYGHPLAEAGKDQVSRQFTIHPPNVSHYIKKFWEDGDLVKGIVETVPDGNGYSMAVRALAGYRPQFSSRGLGSGQNGIVDDASYLLITWDGVQNASHGDALANIGSYQVNELNIPKGNVTLSESASVITLPKPNIEKGFVDILNDKDKLKLEAFCEAFDYQLNTMVLKGNNIEVKRYEGLLVETAIIPLNSIITKNNKIFIM